MPHSREFRQGFRQGWCAFLAAWLVLGAVAPRNASAAEPLRMRVEITSSLDGSLQPCYVILPTDYDPSGPPVPLLVSLHSWSANVEQRNLAFEMEADRRGWIYVFPHFRGPNKHPDACGSRLAQQDILDAVAWVRKQYSVDDRRIYLTGSSGGGHMTLLMVGRHPDVWAAASAWVGITDLVAWHAKHAGSGYGKMIEASCGGPPGTNRQVDQEYAQRSPLTHLHRAKGVPVDIAAGIHDGHTGSVPIDHSLRAFNVLAQVNEAPAIRPDEIAQLMKPDGRLSAPQPSDRVEDAALGRAIYLRRHAGPARVTIFEGGHEGIAAAAADWLSRHRKPAEASGPEAKPPESPRPE